MKKQWTGQYLVVFSTFIFIFIAYQRGFSNENLVSNGFQPGQSNLGENRVLDHLRYEVQYIPQNDIYSCATTSLAMAISYYKKSLLDKDQVWEISGSCKNDLFEYGNDMEGLQRIADYYGYKGAFFEQMSGLTHEDFT